MTDYLTEQEQVELLKKWIKEYSVVILLGITIAIVSLTGWRYWQRHQTAVLTEASTQYNEILTLRMQNQPASSFAAAAEKIITDYPHTVYAAMTCLLLAQYEISTQHPSEANPHLTWVLDHSQIASIKQIARLRLARLLIYQNQPQKALDTLSKVDDKNFIGLIQETTGDAYLALKAPKKAMLAYKEALDELPNAESVRPLLQMKYENLTTLQS